MDISDRFKKAVQDQERSLEESIDRLEQARKQAAEQFLPIREAAERLKNEMAKYRNRGHIEIKSDSVRIIFSGLEKFAVKASYIDSGFYIKDLWGWEKTDKTSEEVIDFLIEQCAKLHPISRKLVEKQFGIKK